MKNLIVLIVLVVSLTGTILAQETQGNIVVVTNMETKANPEGSIAEFDSLNQLYMDKVIKKNDLILSTKTLRHFWGNDNTDFLMMYEVKNWEDIPKANEKNNELFEAAWKTEEERKAYWKAWNAYFTGRHSDEIYMEIKSGTK